MWEALQGAPAPEDLAKGPRLTLATKLKPHRCVPGLLLIVPQDMAQHTRRQAPKAAWCMAMCADGIGSRSGCTLNVSSRM